MEPMKAVATLLLLILSVTSIATQRAASPQCLKVDDANACYNQPIGDYSACSPECITGVYITCDTSGPVKRQCPGEVVYNNQQRASLVFDSDLRRCEYRSPSCPRPDLDPYAPVK